MLILSRKVGETIHVGDGVVLKVLDIREGRGVVRIGITADRQVPVHRGEVWERIQEDKRAEEQKTSAAEQGDLSGRTDPPVPGVAG